MGRAPGVIGDAALTLNLDPHMHSYEKIAIPSDCIVDFDGRGGCPGWQYDRNSALREEALAAYRAVCSKEGTIEATHGGLECRLFVEKLPGLDAVSFGPGLHDFTLLKSG